MKLKGLHYLQFFPIKEPRTEEPDIIAVDPEINGFDESKFIFVDTTFDVTDVVSNYSYVRFYKNF